MKIDFANLKHQYQLYKKDIDDGITRVLENSNYIMGNEIIEFEEDLKISQVVSMHTPVRVGLMHLFLH